MWTRSVPSTFRVSNAGCAAPAAGAWPAGAGPCDSAALSSRAMAPTTAIRRSIRILPLTHILTRKCRTRSPRFTVAQVCSIDDGLVNQRLDALHQGRVVRHQLRHDDISEVLLRIDAERRRGGAA